MRQFAQGLGAIGLNMPATSNLSYNNLLRYTDPTGLKPLEEYNPGLYDIASEFFGDMIENLAEVEIMELLT